MAEIPDDVIEKVVDNLSLIQRNYLYILQNRRATQDLKVMNDYAEQALEALKPYRKDIP